MSRQFRMLQMVSLIVIMVYALLGCSSSTGKGTESSVSASPSATAASSGEDPFKEITALPVTDTLDGLTQINSLIKSFKQAVESDDWETSKQTATELVGVWKAIETELSVIDPNRSETIRGDLALLLEKASSEKNKDELVDVSYSLYQVFRDLKDNVQGTQVQDEPAPDEEILEITP